jgi:hypothetical protein
MNSRAPQDSRLWETLSAYLDGRLAGAEKTALEDRLQKDENLRRELSELRVIRDSLRSLPVLRSPRALTLSPAQAGRSLPQPRGFSTRWMAFGSALAALAFVVVTSVDLFSRGSLLMAAAPRPAALEILPAEAPDQALEKSSRDGAAALTAQPLALATQPLGTAPPALLFAPTAGQTEDVCGDCAAVDTETASNLGAANAFTTESAAQAFSLPDFRTIAPFLEIFLGVSAGLLAILFILSRRRR